MPEPPRSLDDVRLPLYADILQGICLAVPTGQEAKAAAMTSHAPHKPAQRVGSALQPKVPAGQSTCSQRRAPLLPGWLSWQRYQSGGLRSPSQLQPEMIQHQRYNTRDVQPRPGPELLQHHVLPGPAGQGDLTFRIAIGVHRVVGKADLISFASSVNNKIYLNKKERNHGVRPGLSPRQEVG